MRNHVSCTASDVLRAELFLGSPGRRLNRIWRRRVAVLESIVWVPLSRNSILGNFTVHSVTELFSVVLEWPADFVPVASMAVPIAMKTTKVVKMIRIHYHHYENNVDSECELSKRRKPCQAQLPTGAASAYEQVGHICALGSKHRSEFYITPFPRSSRCPIQESVAGILEASEIVFRVLWITFIGLRHPCRVPPLLCIFCPGRARVQVTWSVLIPTLM